MPNVVVVGSGSAFPQSGTSPTRAQAIAELCSYVGGEESTLQQTRAGASLDGAVRAFNDVYWKFNRLVNDITLAAGATFTLTDAFAAPYRACLVDSNSKEVYPVSWMEWGVFVESKQPDLGTSPMPQWYSCRNVHETGVVQVWPQLATPLTYPTLRIYYFRRIVKAATDTDRLNVPEEVYQAIFQFALANFLAKSRDGASRAAAEFQIAANMRARVEQLHRDYQDWS